MMTVYRTEAEELAKKLSAEAYLLLKRGIQEELDARGIPPTHSNAKDAVDSALVRLLDYCAEANASVIDFVYRACFKEHILPNHYLLSQLTIENDEQREKIMMLNLALVN